MLIRFVTMSKGLILVNKRLDQSRVPCNTLPCTCARFQLYLVRLRTLFRFLDIRLLQSIDHDIPFAETLWRSSGRFRST